MFIAKMPSSTAAPLAVKGANHKPGLMKLMTVISRNAPTAYRWYKARYQWVSALAHRYDVYSSWVIANRWTSNTQLIGPGPRRCGCNLKLVNFKLISRTDISSISCKIAPRWMTQRPHRWQVNIGSCNGLIVCCHLISPSCS